jgi:uncharacterized protein YjbI with pentapeptide repeats
MKLILPKIPPAASLDIAEVRQLATEASLTSVRLVGTDASGLRAPNMSIEEAVLEKASLLEARLEKLGLMDVELKACDLSAARCSESSFMRVRIVGGRMTGVDLNQGTLTDVVFEDCKLDMANFRAAKLTRVRFVDCSLVEADFQMAELTDVEFQNCHLEKVEFHQCKLKNVDARTSQLLDIRGWQSLKGLTIDPIQATVIAPQLAAAMGLVIAE